MIETIDSKTRYLFKFNLFSDHIKNNPFVQYNKYKLLNVPFSLAERTKAKLDQETILQL